MGKKEEQKRRGTKYSAKVENQKIFFEKKPNPRSCRKAIGKALESQALKPNEQAKREIETAIYALSGAEKKFFKSSQFKKIKKLLKDNEVTLQIMLDAIFQWSENNPKEFAIYGKSIFEQFQEKEDFLKKGGDFTLNNEEFPVNDKDYQEKYTKLKSQLAVMGKMVDSIEVVRDRDSHITRSKKLRKVEGCFENLESTTKADITTGLNQTLTVIQDWADTNPNEFKKYGPGIWSELNAHLQNNSNQEMIGSTRYQDLDKRVATIDERSDTVKVLKEECQEYMNQQVRNLVQAASEFFPKGQAKEIAVEFQKDCQKVLDDLAKYQPSMLPEYTKMVDQSMTSYLATAIKPGDPVAYYNPIRHRTPEFRSEKLSTIKNAIWMIDKLESPVMQYATKHQSVKAGLTVVNTAYLALAIATCKPAIAHVAIAAVEGGLRGYNFIQLYQIQESYYKEVDKAIQSSSKIQRFQALAASTKKNALHSKSLRFNLREVEKQLRSSSITSQTVLKSIIKWRDKNPKEFAKKGPEFLSKFEEKFPNEINTSQYKTLKRQVEAIKDGRQKQLASRVRKNQTSHPEGKYYDRLKNLESDADPITVLSAIKHWASQNPDQFAQNGPEVVEGLVNREIEGALSQNPEFKALKDQVNTVKQARSKLYKQLAASKTKLSRHRYPSQKEIERLVSSNSDPSFVLSKVQSWRNQKPRQFVSSGASVVKSLVEIFKENYIGERPEGLQELVEQIERIDQEKDQKH